MISVASRTGFKEEVTNIFMDFPNGMQISIGMSAAHYCYPKVPMGLNPERQKVEVAVFSPEADAVTRRVWNTLFPTDQQPEDEFEPHVGWVDSAELGRIIGHVSALHLPGLG